MNSALSRLNGLFAFTLTVLGGITVLCYLSTAFMDRSVPDSSAAASPSYSIKLHSVPNPRGGAHHDMGSLLLDISADFSKMFDWNTKQLFVYVVTHYKNSRQPVNEVVLWDKIMLRGQNTSLNAVSSRPKYPFIDYGQALRDNRDVQMYLCWNIVPLAGLLPLVCSQPSVAQFPNHYSN